jgi:hypothetical protein
MFLSTAVHFPVILDGQFSSFPPRNAPSAGSLPIPGQGYDSLFGLLSHRSSRNILAELKPFVVYNFPCDTLIPSWLSLTACIQFPVTTLTLRIISFRLTAITKGS